MANRPMENHASFDQYPGEQFKTLGMYYWKVKTYDFTRMWRNKKTPCILVMGGTCSHHKNPKQAPQKNLDIPIVWPSNPS